MAPRLMLPDSFENPLNTSASTIRMCASAWPGVKNKVIVLDDKNRHEFTTWKATDLKKFPIKIVDTKDGRSIEMLFKNIMPCYSIGVILRLA